MRYERVNGTNGNISSDVPLDHSFHEMLLDVHEVVLLEKAKHTPGKNDWVKSGKTTDYKFFPDTQYESEPYFKATCRGWKNVVYICHKDGMRIWDDLMIETASFTTGAQDK